MESELRHGEAANGRDWSDPMIALHRRLGPATRGTLARSLWLPVVVNFGAGSVLLTLAAYGVRLLLAR